MYVLKKNLLSSYKKLAIIIASIATTQVITGSLLALLSDKTSSIVYCSKIGIYIAVLFVIEYLLLRKMQKKDNFSVNFVKFSSFSSFATFVFTLKYLY